MDVSLIAMILSPRTNIATLIFRRETAQKSFLLEQTIRYLRSLRSCPLEYDTILFTNYMQKSQNMEFFLIG